MDNVCLCEAPRIKAKFRRTWECTICGKPEQPNTAEAAHPAPATVESASVRMKARAFDQLKELGGWFQNGSETTIKLSPDDATRTWHVTAGNQQGYGSTIAEALDAALAPATEGRKS